MWKFRVSLICPWIAGAIVLRAVWLQLNTNTPSRVLADMGLVGAFIALIGILAPYTMRQRRAAMIEAMTVREAVGMVQYVQEGSSYRHCPPPLIGTMIQLPSRTAAPPTVVFEAPVGSSAVAR
jgi:hypothetical protein